MSKGLTRDAVVTAALSVLDGTGLDGLNMRALATRLEVKAPALYWHFASKQDLVDEMATAIWREVQAELPELTDDWGDNMIQFATTLRTVLLRHRDGARLFSGTYLTDVSVLQAQEKPLAATVASGIPLETAIEVSSVLYNYTVGTCIEEQSVRQTAEIDDRYELSARERRLDPELYPLMTEAGRMTFPDPAARFDSTVHKLVAAFRYWGAGS